MVANTGRKIPQVGGNADLDAFRAEGESNGISRVVRNGERFHRDVANLEAMAGFEALILLELRPLTLLMSNRPRPGLVRGAGHVDRDAQFLCQRGQSVDMVGMLVGDQNGRERVRVLSQSLHAPESLAAGDAGVDQNFGACARHNGAISPAAAGQHRDTQTHAGSIRAQAVNRGVTFWLSDTLEFPASGVRLPLSGFGLTSRRVTSTTVANATASRESDADSRKPASLPLPHIV